MPSFDNEGWHAFCRQVQDSTSEEDKDWEAAVLGALRCNDPHLLRQLIRSLDAGPNALLAEGESMLLHAVDLNLPACVSTLIDSGASLEFHQRKYSPLFVAAEKGWLEIVRLLLQRGGNLTGEFDFNKETVLSIAAFKLCWFVSSCLAKCGIQTTDAQRLIEAGPYNNWRLFGELEEELSFTLAESALRVAIGALASSAFHSLGGHDLDQLKQRLAVYTLVHDKACVVRKRSDRMILSHSRYLRYATTRFHGAPVQDYQCTRLQASVPVDPIPKLTKAALLTTVAQLNRDLSSGIPIDWSTQPRLFVAQWRGMHYFGCYFDDLARQDHIQTTHLHRVAPAPAVYSMSSLSLGANQMARESVLKQDGDRLRQAFDSVSDAANAKAQLHMSSKYGDYMRSVTKDSDVELYATLYSIKATGYPHYATSDLPYHALRYAAGLKPVDPLKRSRRRPNYNALGKPQHPVLGKIFICLLRPQDLAAHRVVHVSTEQGPELSYWVRPERETSFTGVVAEEIVFFEGLFDVPDFSQSHSAAVEERFGLTLAKFHAQRKTIHRLSEEHLDKFLDDLAHHQTERLLRLAQTEALRRGGHLVYSPRVNVLSLYRAPLHRNVPLVPAKGAQAKHLRATYGDLYKWEHELMHRVGEERFSDAGVSSSAAGSQAPSAAALRIPRVQSDVQWIPTAWRPWRRCTNSWPSNQCLGR